MRFHGLDLNLLAAFAVLLEERSVSRAAKRLNLSQPAMSAVLTRLREFFADPILVVQGKRMHPTAYAESLLPRIAQCLQDLEALVISVPHFVPATSQRNFRIVTSDYILAALVVPLVERLAKLAPLVRLEILLTTEQSVQLLEEGKIDLLITPDLFTVAGHPTEHLFDERYVVVGWKGNSLFDDGLTEAGFAAAGHVAVRLGNTRAQAFADRQLELMGRTRRIEITAPSFTTVPWLIEGTSRLALMHERLARVVGRRFPIATAPIPFPFPLMREMVQYHRAREGDDGLAWLRKQIHLTAAELDAPPS